MICVLLLAAGHPWESVALGHLEPHPATTVLKRCVDVDDLLAAATTDQAHAAVLTLDAPGLDPAAIAHLVSHGVRPVLVTQARPDDLDVQEQARRLRVDTVVGTGDLDTLPAVLAAGERVAETRPRVLEQAGAPAAESIAEQRRTFVVWGPAGAPGRTTVAVNLAAELAGRARPVVLADLDPHGGTVAQQLGILDEVSGVLAGARLAGSGQLSQRFPSVCRAVGEHLNVLTGLPRADRWREVRVAHAEELLDRARHLGDVVVDTGFSIEEDPGEFGGRATRNSMTLTAIGEADEVVVVGGADPVGLTRLARGLVELAESFPGVPLRVVVNRMRSSIGWSERDVARMVEGFARVSGLHFLPEDRPLADRALVSGRPLVELGDSSLAAGIAALADALLPASAGAVRRRRGGRALLR